MHLCLLDLAEITGGWLRLAAMPPRDGELATIGRIVLSPQFVEPGDVFWRFGDQGGEVELVFLRGALGVVTSSHRLEPWPGRFCLIVDDAKAAFERVIDEIRHAGDVVQRLPDIIDGQVKPQFGDSSSELKVLQLCADRVADNYPLTCGQSAKGHSVRRCRRRAA